MEKITDAEVTCPDISGIMGAFGAALIARSHDCSQKTSLLSAEEISDFTYTSAIRRCTGCSNHCMLTVNTFSNGKKHISGNRCEKGIRTTSAEKDEKNMVAFKRRRLFDYPILAETEAYRGTIGIPRVLNLYENYPFWAVFFRKLEFRIVLSPFSDRSIYEMGMESIPSESVCYPAKLSHGHVQWLIHNGMHTIFYPCVFYEHQETPDAQNHYNCPIVISYPKNIKNNVEQIADGSVKLIRPFISFANEKTAADRNSF